MWTRIGAPHESLVSISLDRGDVGKDFMAEIDTRTCVGQVSGRMEARGSTRLARSLLVATNPSSLDEAFTRRWMVDARVNAVRANLKGRLGA